MLAVWCRKYPRFPRSPLDGVRYDYLKRWTERAWDIAAEGYSNNLRLLVPQEKWDLLFAWFIKLQDILIKVEQERAYALPPGPA